MLRPLWPLAAVLLLSMSGYAEFVDEPLSDTPVPEVSVPEIPFPLIELPLLEGLPQPPACSPAFPPTDLNTGILPGSLPLSISGEPLEQAVDVSDIETRALNSGSELETSQVPAVATVIAQRAALIQSLQQLQDQYCKAGMLDEAIAVRDQVRRLQADAQVLLPPVPAPAAVSTTSTTPGQTPYELRGHVGEVHVLQVTGSTIGAVWGTGIYTDDSDVGTAAVHAGILKSGETKLVAFRVLKGEPQYSASTANGITSRVWERWSGSYELIGTCIMAADFAHHNDPAKQELVSLFVTGSDDGFVWGSEIYTNDSNLGTAAVHAGLLKVGESGVIEVELLPGQETYESSAANGITTRPYHSWSGSIRLHRAPGKASGDQRGFQGENGRYPPTFW